MTGAYESSYAVRARCPLVTFAPGPIVTRHIKQDAEDTMKLSPDIVDIGGVPSAPGAKIYRLTPRRRYPTLRVKPFRRSPLSRLAWIFGLAR